jgi:ankyrin repeat protein
LSRSFRKSKDLSEKTELRVVEIFFKLLYQTIIEEEKNNHMEKIKRNENNVTFTEIKQLLNADWGDGRSLLHLAVEQDDFKLVKQCIQFKADVNKVDNDGCTALFFCNSIEIAKFLVDNGTDVNILNIYGDTAVIRLFYRKNSDIIKYLAGITNLDLEGGKNYPVTLLNEMILCEEKDLSLFKIVIPRTKNINRIDGYSRSYLMNAAKNSKYLDEIMLLAESGIDLYIRDRDGKNFYDLSFKYVQKEIEKNYPEFMMRKGMTDQQRQVLDRSDKLKHLNSISNCDD